MDLQGQRSSTLLSEGTMAEVMDSIKSDMGCFFKEDPGLCFLDVSSSSLQDQYVYSPEVPDSTQPMFVEEEVVVSSATCHWPSKEDYMGPFKFCVELEKSSSDRNKWVYSPTLNKIYVTMHSKVPIKFKWDYLDTGLYVRALPIFLEEDFFEQPVVRCLAHRSTEDVSNNDFSYVEHIIRCDNTNTTYMKDEKSERLSVLVPLEFPHPGSEWSTIFYQFMCKNSCCMGMNRRATAIIFTLENKQGNVLGRKMFKLRICSCPKRDMGKEEKDFFKNKEAEKYQEISVQEPIRGKRIVIPQKKIMKRPSHPQGIKKFLVNLPELYVKNVAKYIQNTISLMEEERALTEEEMNAMKECEKYLK